MTGGRSGRSSTVKMSRPWCSTSRCPASTAGKWCGASAEAAVEVEAHCGDQQAGENQREQAERPGERERDGDGACAVDGQLTAGDRCIEAIRRCGGTRRARAEG